MLSPLGTRPGPRPTRCSTASTAPARSPTRAAGRQPGRPVGLAQARCVLGVRAEPGQDAAAMIEPGPQQRAEHRGGIPPPDDPDVQAAGHDPAFARPAFRRRTCLEGAGDDGVRQPECVRRGNGDDARLGNDVGKFQADRVRQGGQDLARPARAAQHIADGQAGHPGARQRRPGVFAGVDRPGWSAACPRHARHSIAAGAPCLTARSEINKRKAKKPIRDTHDKFVVQAYEGRRGCLGSGGPSAPPAR